MNWVWLVLIGVGYDWMTLMWLKRWLVPLKGGAPSVPVTIFRPLKRGVPEIGMKLRSFLQAVQPDDQILIAVYEDDILTKNEARAALADFPLLDVQIISCRSDAALNPKINKLLQLAPLARCDHWIVLDSEFLDAATFLPQFRFEWNSLQFPVLSAPYRFRKLTLSTAPVLHTLLPGLAVLQRFGKIANTLGAALAVTRSQIEKLGGWESLAYELAEDFQLGHRLAAMGVPVRLSRAVVTLDNDPASLVSSLGQLHRISATYRRCQPAGFAGSIVLHSVTWSLFLAVFHPFGWIGFLLASLSRIIVCQQRARALGWPISYGRWLLIPISSLLETVFWIAAWLPLPVHWAGRRFK
ncbi:MAG: glycosyltransferase [Chthoniobacterales bacterium]